MIENLAKFYELNPLGIFSVFTLGVLIIILIQNTFFYFNYKDKAYLWYAIYALIILLDQLFFNVSIYYVKILKTKFTLFYQPIHYGFEWLYNCAYLIFVIEFGGFLLFKNQTAKILKRVVSLLVFVLLILFSADIFLQTHLVKKGFLFLLVPTLIVMSIFMYYHLFRMKTNIKYYIILGSIIFSVFSVISLIVSQSENKYTFYAWSFFYIGVFFENIFFSLGLAKKQSILLQERNETQEKLIEQYKENETLKNALTETLQKEVELKTSEVISLNKIAEEERIKKLELAYEKEIAELKILSLQSQMNPHFIFNSLNSIKLNIIKNNKENAVHYLNKFSKLIRKILTISREKEVSLQDELDTLQLYVSIENMRLKNELNFTLTIDEDLNTETIKIPPLILQPFIENAIWHGLMPKDGEKKIDLNVKKQHEKSIVITIEDNGIGRQKAQEFKDKKLHQRKSVGLKLTDERLGVFSSHLQEKHSIIFEDLVDGDNALGTRVTIMVFYR